jgi:hypothetical protein
MTPARVAASTSTRSSPTLQLTSRRVRSSRAKTSAVQKPPPAMIASARRTVSIWPRTSVEGRNA